MRKNVNQLHSYNDNTKLTLCQVYNYELKERLELAPVRARRGLTLLHPVNLVLKVILNLPAPGLKVIDAI